MSKFTFTSNFVPDQMDRTSTACKVTHEFEAESLDVILRQFTDFLRGAGFHFEGDVEIVDNTLPLTDEGNDSIPVPANLPGVKGNFYVDPPSGWKYGFPRPYNAENDGPLGEFLIKNGYPEKDVKFAAQHCRVFAAEEYSKQYNDTK